MASVKEEVEEQVARVRGIWAEAVNKLEEKWFGGAEKDNALKMLRGNFMTWIAKWAADGIAAANAGKPPYGKNDWTAWRTKGQELLDGVEAQAELGDKGQLENIEQTLAEAPEVSAKAARKVVKETTAIAAEGVSNIVGSLMPILVVAGVLGAAFLAWRFMPRGGAA